MFDNLNSLFSQSTSIPKFINRIEIIDNGNNTQFENIYILIPQCIIIVNKINDIFSTYPNMTLLLL